MNNLINVSLGTSKRNSLVLIFKSRIVGFQSVLLCNHISILQKYSLKWLTNIYSHAYSGILILHFLSSLVLSDFLIFVNLIIMKFYYSLICISVLANQVIYCFICLLPFSFPLQWNNCLYSLPILLFGYLFLNGRHEFLI